MLFVRLNTVAHLTVLSSQINAMFIRIMSRIQYSVTDKENMSKRMCSHLFSVNPANKNMI